MVQYSFSISNGEKFSNQSINLKKITYSFKAFLFKKTEKRCRNPASKENRVDYSMPDESKAKISL